jgi:thiamine-monophosphate kinase
VHMGDGGEFDAIRAMLGVWGDRARGIGDDAAVLVVPPGLHLVASTDASVEGVHFKREWLTPQEIGSRAVVAALSDLAAMGALPTGLLLSLGVPTEWKSSLLALARGVGDAAAAAGCPIVGGNVSRAHELSLTVTVLGTAKHPLTRAGVVPGDIIFVTGRLGGPHAAVRAWMTGGTPRAEHRARFADPRPRIAEGAWLADAGAHAAIDISDGLRADAGHLARASGVEIEIEMAAVPCLSHVAPEDVASGGEEYELLVAFPADRLPDPAEFERRFALPLTAVGVAGEGAGVELVGENRAEPVRGHDHFA